jgi:hypothetical protein
MYLKPKFANLAAKKAHLARIPQIVSRYRGLAASSSTTVTGTVIDLG